MSSSSLLIVFFLLYDFRYWLEDCGDISRPSQNRLPYCNLSRKLLVEEWAHCRFSQVFSFLLDDLHVCKCRSWYYKNVCCRLHDILEQALNRLQHSNSWNDAFLLIFSSEGCQWRHWSSIWVFTLSAFDSNHDARRCFTSLLAEELQGKAVLYIPVYSLNKYKAPSLVTLLVPPELKYVEWLHISCV